MLPLPKSKQNDTLQQTTKEWQPDLPLLVRVTKRPIHGAYKVTNLPHLVAHNPKINKVIETLLLAKAHHGRATRHDIRAGIQVLHLPDGPGSVNLSVVHPEGRIVGRGVEVAARVTGNGEVACAVDARAALHYVLERAEVLAGCDEAEDVLGAEVSAGEVVGNVTSQAAGIDSVTVGTRISGRRWVDCWGYWAEVDDHAGEL